MSSSPRKGSLEHQLEALRPALADPASPQSRELLKEALLRSRSFVSARAAEVIRDKRVEGFGKDLAATFERFSTDGVKSDPGCKAKLAALEALDLLESLDAEPFLAAVRCFQLEPAWGEPVDTATGVRGRGALALARLGHEDFLLLMADLLVDPLAVVRQAAAEAILHRGEPQGAALLQLKLRTPEEEPAVTLAALSGVVALAPVWGVAQARAFLREGTAELREVAALALGQSRRDDALTALLEGLEAASLSADRQLFLRALGLHRSDKALEALLDVIATGGRADATKAVESIAPRCFEPGVRVRVEEAARRNAEVNLTEALRKVKKDAG